MPGPDDTFTAGEGGREFPTTLWSDILAAGDPESPSHRERLEQLLRRYWRPVFTYIRIGWRRPIEESKDLTQAFFARILEKGYLSRMRPDKGSFRGYLKRALKHFLIDQKRAADVRRPPGGAIVPLDAHEAELAALGGSEDDDPERAFDRQWVTTVLDDAVARLERTLEETGRAHYFKAFHAYCVAPHAAPAPGATPASSSRPPTYREVATSLGVKESDVRNYLSVCRDLLRRVLRTRIRDYAGDEGEVERELLEVRGG